MPAALYELCIGILNWIVRQKFSIENALYSIKHVGLAPSTFLLLFYLFSFFPLLLSFIQAKANAGR